MKHALVLTSTFPLKRESYINPSVRNLVLALSKKIKVTLLLPDHVALETRYLNDRNIRIIRFKYFWPRSLQKLVYGSGIIPNIKANPLLFFEILPFIIFQSIAIKKVIRASRVDTVLANWAIPSGLSAALSGLSNDSKLITYAHGSDANIQSAPYNAVLRFVVNRSNVVIAVSKSLARKISLKANRPNITVIPQGVNLTKPKQKIRKKHLVFAGRLIEGKGAINLVRAFEMILSKYPEYTLLIIGDGPRKGYLKQYIKRNRIRNIKLLGSVPNAKLMDILQSSMLLVFPSNLPEGLPNILLEAGVCKIPILTSKAGGASDLISERSGYFTKTDPRQIADNIDKILSNYKTATSKSNVLFKKIKDSFSTDNSATQLLKIIDNL